MINSTQTVGELVVKHPQLRSRLEKFGIDYCCGGKQTLAEAVKALGLEQSSVLEELKSALAEESQETVQTDWSKVSATKLIEHILDKHHAFMKEQLPRLDELFRKVQNAHAEKHGKMLEALYRDFTEIKEEVEPHLMKEEQILFPGIEAIDRYLAGSGSFPRLHCGSVANPIQQMEYEHEHVGRALERMRQNSAEYQLPADACEAFKALYDGLQAIEADLHEHIHLENNILFPQSIDMETSINAG